MDPIIFDFDWASLGKAIMDGIRSGLPSAGNLMGELFTYNEDHWLYSLLNKREPYVDPNPPPPEQKAVGSKKALKKEFAGAFDFVGPTMTPETALDFASSRSSGFDALGKNVFNSRDMIAGLRHAGAISVRIAETATAELAALRAEVAGQTTSSNTSGQTNYFTFNITAGDEAEARTGVLNALRDAGVAF